jgi:phage terminase large subunit-like protein
LPTLPILRAPGRSWRGDGARLGEAVALVDRDAEAVDELGDVLRERRAARERVLQAAAEPRAHLGEDDLVREGEHEPLLEAELLARALLVSRSERRLDHALHEAWALGDLLLYTRRRCG